MKIRFIFFYRHFILYTIYFGAQNKKKLPITLLCYKYFFQNRSLIGNFFILSPIICKYLLEFVYSIQDEISIKKKIYN